MPVRLHGAHVGTLSLLRLAGAPFASAELALLEGMALQAALALDGQRIASELETSFLATIDALVRALEAQDLYTSGHALSIADLARRVGRVLGLDAAALRDVEHAAVLHDIGKIGIPSELLRKRGPLDSGEREHMREHPEIGARILEPVERLRQLAPLVRFSHECWDGSGYPDGLAGEQIPLGARIISVCDAFDAMVSDRPYRGGRSTAGRARGAAGATPARSSIRRSSRPSSRRCATHRAPSPTPDAGCSRKQESGATGAGIRSRRCLNSMVAGGASRARQDASLRVSRCVRP